MMTSRDKISGIQQPFMDTLPNTVPDVLTTYGGKFGVQGPTQALSRDVIVAQQNKIVRALTGSDRMEGVTLAVHNEVVACVREDRAEWALNMMLEVMHTPPDWCADLPLAAEGAIGQRYSEAK